MVAKPQRQPFFVALDEEVDGTFLFVELSGQYPAIHGLFIEGGHQRHDVQRGLHDANIGDDTAVGNQSRITPQLERTNHLLHTFNI